MTMAIDSSSRSIGSNVPESGGGDSGNAGGTSLRGSGGGWRRHFSFHKSLSYNGTSSNATTGAVVGVRKSLSFHVLSDENQPEEEEEDDVVCQPTTRLLENDIANHVATTEASSSSAPPLVWRESPTQMSFASSHQAGDSGASSLSHSTPPTIPTADLEEKHDEEKNKDKVNNAIYSPAIDEEEEQASMYRANPTTVSSAEEEPRRLIQQLACFRNSYGKQHDDEEEDNDVEHQGPMTLCNLQRIQKLGCTMGGGGKSQRSKAKKSSKKNKKIDPELDLLDEELSVICEEQEQTKEKSQRISLNHHNSKGSSLLKFTSQPSMDSENPVARPFPTKDGARCPVWKKRLLDAKKRVANLRVGSKASPSSRANKTPSPKTNNNNNATFSGTSLFQAMNFLQATEANDYGSFSTSDDSSTCWEEHDDLPWDITIPTGQNMTTAKDYNNKSGQHVGGNHHPHDVKSITSSITSGSSSCVTRTTEHSSETSMSSLSGEQMVAVGSSWEWVDYHLLDSVCNHGDQHSKKKTDTVSGAMDLCHPSDTTSFALQHVLDTAACG